MSTDDTPRRRVKLAGPDSIRAILEEFVNEGIEAACNAAYSAGFEDGYRLALDELRHGLDDVCDRVLPRITGRVDDQRSGRVSTKPLRDRRTKPLTKRQREYVEYVAQFPNGITATEYRTQTGRADVGLYKLEKRGVLVKRGARFYVPAFLEHHHSSAEG